MNPNVHPVNNVYSGQVVKPTVSAVVVLVLACGAQLMVRPHPRRDRVQMATSVRPVETGGDLVSG